MNKEKFYTDKKNIVILAIICCALWGSAYPAIKIGYELFNIAPNDVPSKLIFAGYRFIIAGIIVLVFQMIEGKRVILARRKLVGQVVLLGLMQTTFQYACFYIGLSNTTGISGSIVNGTGTFFSIILAHFLYTNDKINLNKILGCLIGFGGVVIVNLSGGNSLFESSFTFQGEGLIMVSAFALSLSSIYGKKISQSEDAATLTGYQLAIGGLILAILGFIFGGTLNEISFKGIVLLIYMSILSSVAFVIWSQLMKYNKVGTIAMFNFLIPVFGTLLSAIFLGENIFDIKIVISLLMVSIGIFMVYKKSSSET